MRGEVGSVLRLLVEQRESCRHTRRGSPIFTQPLSVISRLDTFRSLPGTPRGRSALPCSRGSSHTHPSQGV